MSRSDAGAGSALYGIANCDKVRRARAWFADHGLALRFHDFKSAGVPVDRLAAWLAEVGWERLLNRSGTTWRRLPEDRRAAVADAAGAAALMREQPSVIRRPIVEWPDGAISVGFDADDFGRRAAAASGDPATP